MARRKDITPPLEIMGKAPPRQPWHERAQSGEKSEDPSAPGRPGLSEGLSPKQWKQWLTHTGPPLVLRVPRGLAIAVVAGVLALLVIAYWVGLERGEAAAREMLKTQQSESVGRFGRIPGGFELPDRTNAMDNATGRDTDRTGRGEGTAAYETNGRPTIVRLPRDAGPDADPRQVGLNYLVLATWNAADAERLAEFLRDRGVATLLKPWDDKRLRVVAIDRGFGRDEGEARRAYRREMLDVGKAWQRHNNGRGSALTDMHFDKFEG